MLLRYSILNTLLLLLSLSAVAQRQSPDHRYKSGDDDGYVQDVNFGVEATITPDTVYELMASTLTAAASGVGVFSYAWKKINSDSTYSEESILRFSNAALADSGRYYCLVSNGAIIRSSDTLLLTVLSFKRSFAYKGGDDDGYVQDVNFEVEATITPDTVCKLMASTLTTTASGVGVFAYAWHKIDIDSTYSEESILRFSNAALADSGRYYCLVSNRGAILSTDTLKLVVLELPSAKIDHSYASDTICQDSLLIVSLSTKGVGLSYDWCVLKKGESIPDTIKDPQDDPTYTGELNLATTLAHDSSQIWCHVYNDCGETFSDTLLLRIDTPRNLAISPQDTTVCPGADAQIVLTLKDGNFPWSYSLVDETGLEIERSVDNSLTDTLDVNLKGKYTVQFVSDGSACSHTVGDDTLRVHHHDARDILNAHLSLFGKDTVCIGEKVRVVVSISLPPSGEGTAITRGAWEIVFADKYGDAMNGGMGLSNPYVIYRDDISSLLIHDTIPPFMMYSTDTLFLGSVKDLIEEDRICSGTVSGGVPFVILPSDNIRFDFKDNDDIVGICETIGLDTRLNPSLPGIFSINGVEVLDNQFDAEALGEGMHAISYTTDGGCPRTENVNLIVVAAPSVEITPVDTSICPAETVEITFDASGEAPLKLEYERVTIKRDGSITSNLLDKTDFLASIKVTNSNSLDDSLCVITPLLLEDSFGCAAELDSLVAASVLFQVESESTVLGRYVPKDGQEWRPTDKPFMIDAGGEVEYRIEFAEGSAPWYCDVMHPKLGALPTLGPIYGVDTIYKASAVGEYTFSVRSEFSCSNPETSVKSSIFYIKEEYLRIRALLQGASVERDGKDCMHAELQRLGILQTEGLDFIPTVGTDSITDFIVAKLYEEIYLPPVAQDTFLLRNDGQLLMRDGNDTLVFSNSSVLNSSSYYVALVHRNHLSVMSAEKVLVGVANKLNVEEYDFTLAGAVLYPPDNQQAMHMTELGSGAWCMTAGYKLSDDELVSISNPNAVKLLAPDDSNKGYFMLDVNMNGVVGYPDNTSTGYIYPPDGEELWRTKDFWILHRNRDKYSTVPEE